MAVIFADNSFVTMSPNSFNFHAIDYRAIDVINSNPGPVWIYVEKNESAAQLSSVEYFKRFGPPHLHVAGYRPLNKWLDQVGARGLREIEIDGQTLSTPTENARFYPLLTRYYEGYLLLNSTDGTVLDVHVTQPTSDYGVDVQ